MIHLATVSSLGGCLLSALSVGSMLPVSMGGSDFSVSVYGLSLAVSTIHLATGGSLELASFLLSRSAWCLLVWGRSEVMLDARRIPERERWLIVDVIAQVCSSATS